MRKEIPIPDLPAIYASDIAPDGTYVVLTGPGEVLNVDLETGATEVRVTVPDAPFDNLAFAEDGTLYLSSFLGPSITAVAPDGTISVINVGSA